MKRTTFTLLLLLAVSSFAFAQQDARGIRLRNQPLFDKFIELQIYNHLLPVLITPDQMRKILPLVEKAKKADIDLAEAEIARLNKLRDELEAALAAAKKRDQVPGREFLDKLRKEEATISNTRILVINMYTEQFYTLLKEVLNEGQIKSAANSILWEVKEGDPEPTQDMKFKHWIRVVLLEPLAYPILVEFAKRQ